MGEHELRHFPLNHDMVFEALCWPLPPPENWLRVPIAAGKGRCLR